MDKSSFWAAIGAAAVAGLFAFFGIIYSKHHDKQSISDAATDKARADLFTYYNGLITALTGRITSQEGDLQSAWTEIRGLRTENNECHGRLSELEMTIELIKFQLAKQGIEIPLKVHTKEGSDDDE